MSAEYDEDEGGNQLVEGEETHVNDSDLKLPTDVDLSAFNKRVATGEEDEDVLHKVCVRIDIGEGAAPARGREAPRRAAAATRCVAWPPRRRPTRVRAAAAHPRARSTLVSPPPLCPAAP